MGRNKNIEYIEANSQEQACLLWNPKFHYRVTTVQLNLLNPFCYVCDIGHVKLSLQSISRLSKLTINQRLKQNAIHNNALP